MTSQGASVIQQHNFFIFYVRTVVYIYVSPHLTHRYTGSEESHPPTSSSNVYYIEKVSSFFVCNTLAVSHPQGISYLYCIKYELTFQTGVMNRLRYYFPTQINMFHCINPRLYADKSAFFSRQYPDFKHFRVESTEVMNIATPSGTIGPRSALSVSFRKLPSDVPSSSCAPRGSEQ